MKTCPSCNSSDIRPSRTRNKKNPLQFFAVYYRCKWCGRTFLGLRKNSEDETTRKSA